MCLRPRIMGVALLAAGAFLDAGVPWDRATSTA